MNEKRTNQKKDGKGGKKTMGNGCRDFPRGAAMSLTQRDTKYVEKQKREGRQINDGRDTQTINPHLCKILVSPLTLTSTRCLIDCKADRYLSLQCLQQQSAKWSDSPFVWAERTLQSQIRFFTSAHFVK